ncbi:hypothetical protein AB0F17_54300 [Nonomuraea sp. NPDC026600]|uniref:hypothetical protein n=1 Tax=Nonomuraea sp. NPDC026600 TaxID=3155363 RepID=UPI0033FB78DB
MSASAAGWVVITNYPAWPSPYFAELHRHAPPGPAVINLHRLKRLYQGPDGQRTLAAAHTIAAQLQALHEGGWRIAWTVHNLLPIDGGPPTEADQYTTSAVLELADAVITHTRADAAYLTSLTKRPSRSPDGRGSAAPPWAASSPPPCASWPIGSRTPRSRW